MTLPHKIRIGCCFLALGAVLSVYKGYLAIFREGQPPQRIAPCRALLPENARLALEQGIPFSDDLELCHILDDYLS